MQRLISLCILQCKKCETLEFAIFLQKAGNMDFPLILISLNVVVSLSDFSNRWCKRENVEPDALMILSHLSEYLCEYGNLKFAA